MKIRANEINLKDAEHFDCFISITVKSKLKHRCVKQADKTVLPYQIVKDSAQVLDRMFRQQILGKEKGKFTSS